VSGPAVDEGAATGAEGAAGPGYDIVDEAAPGGEPGAGAPAFGEPAAEGFEAGDGAAPVGDEPVGPAEAAPGLAWDEHDDSAKVTLDRLDFLQRQQADAAAPAVLEEPGAAEAPGVFEEPAIPAAPELPEEPLVEAASDLAPFDIGGPSVGDVVEEAAAEVSSEIATGEIQVDELEEAAPPPRRPSVPPPPPRPPRRRS
jgi:hypothetical protein